MTRRSRVARMRARINGHSSLVEIDWGSASVKDARLTVALSGDAPKGFNGQLERVVAQLSTSGHRWGAIEAGKRKLHVDDVEAGAEADLRHFLESALLQANAAAGAEPTGSPDGEEPSADERMASVFRSFADR